MLAWGFCELVNRPAEARGVISQIKNGGATHHGASVFVCDSEQVNDHSFSMALR